MTGTRLVVVLGMHRSGTSAITRALQVLQVHLGDRLMPPHEQINARGFWEDLDIYELNVEMLHALDTEWYQASPITEADVEILRAKGFVLKATALLRRKMAHCELFGFKDPRLGRLLPFWLEVFRHDAIDVRYILALRNPMSVAASLRKRDGFEASFSYLLWLVHTVGSVAGSVDRPRIAVDFDRLLQDPRRQLERIAALVEREVDPQAMEAFAGEFLAEELRHSAFRVDDLRLDPDCPQLVATYFEELLRAAADEIGLDAPALLQRHDECRVALAGMAPAIQAMDRLQTEAIALRASKGELQARVAERDELQRQLTQSNEQSAQIQQQLGAMEGRLVEANAETGRHAALVVELQGTLASQTEALAQSQRQMEELNSKAAGLAQDLAQQQEHAAQLQQQLSEATENLAESAAEKDRQAGLAAELQAMLASQGEALAQSQTQMEERNSRVAGLEQELAQLRAHSAQIQEQLTSAEGNLAQAASENARQAALVADLQTTLAARTEALTQSQCLMEEQRSRAAELEQALGQEREQTAQLQQQLNAAEGRLAESAAESVRQATQVLELQEALASRSEALAQGQRQMQEQAARVAALELALTEREQQIAQTEARAAQQESELENRRQRMEQQSVQLTELEVLSLQQAAALAQREQTEADLRQAFADAQASWGERSQSADAEQSALVQALQEVQQRLGEMSERAGRAERENREIRASWLWRIAGPRQLAARGQNDAGPQTQLDR